MAAIRTERRTHQRAAVPCVITLEDSEGNVLHRTKAHNLSDGGVFLAMPIDVLPHFGAELNLSFSVPRTTSNTYMLEQFNCKARIVRHQPLVDCDTAGMGLQFTKPQDLMLEA